MPEDAELALARLAVAVGFDRVVHAEELVVLGEDLVDAAIGVVVEDEVFQQVEEIRFVTDAPQHGAEIGAPLVRLGEALPLVEELVLAAEGADARVLAVAQDEKGVVVKELRDGVAVVAVVVDIGVLDVDGVLLELHEQ